MSGKPVVRLEAARQDEREAIRYYASEAGLDVALGFRDALREAYRAIGDRPGAGSLRYADLVGAPNLRSRRLSRFPFLIFYAEEEARISVWRILHAQRDIGRLLTESEAEGPA